MSAGHDFNTVTKGHDEWLTPKYITDALGPFDLDPCSPGEWRPWDTALVHIGKPDCGLSAEWSGRVWLNPPYGRETFTWLRKLADHGSGIALIFARTETVGFHEQVWNRADSVFFFKGRLRFHKVCGTEADTANAPSVLVSYSKEDTAILAAAGLSGRLVHLGKTPSGDYDEI